MRGEPRLWVVGLTLPFAVGAATFLGILAAPASPLEHTSGAGDLGIALLLGTFLVLCGAFATVAAVLWHKSRAPLSTYHELIATLPEELGEEADETDPESRP